VNRLVAAELRKLWTVRATWVLTVVGLAMVALSVAATVFGAAPVPAFGPGPSVVTAIDDIGPNGVIVLVVALLITTNEFRHATIGRTLQLTPSRLRVLTSKLLASAVYAVAFFGAALVIVAGMLLVRAGTAAAALETGQGIGRALVAAVAGLVLLGVVGVHGVAGVGRHHRRGGHGAGIRLVVLAEHAAQHVLQERALGGRVGLGADLLVVEGHEHRHLRGVLGRDDRLDPGVGAQEVVQSPRGEQLVVLAQIGGLVESGREQVEAQDVARVDSALTAVGGAA
jgi:hypothetical protein